MGLRLPHRSILDRCATLNPHGFGFATKDRVFKTLSYEEFKRELKTIGKDETAILHFRYATHGSIKADNCHPFRDDETGIAFAHNGILNITPQGDMTDSETAFRNILVPTIKEHGFGSDRFITTTYNIIGASRFAFIDKNGDYSLYGSFVHHKGLWYSNRNFLPYIERYSYIY